MPNFPTRIRPLLDALSVAYGLKYQVVHADAADTDTLRAISEFAPMVTETCHRRYGFVEEITLRLYVDVMVDALAAMPRGEINVVSEPMDYDTRTADGATCFAFQDTSDPASFPMYVVKVYRLGSHLPAPYGDGPSASGRDVKVTDLVDSRTGATYESEMAANAELERAAFETSRRMYAEQVAADAAAGSGEVAGAVDCL